MADHSGSSWRSRPGIFGNDLMHIFYVVIAMAAAILILAGYFFEAFSGIQTLLLNWAVILAGMAVLAGILNLFAVHSDKVRRGERGSTYSALLIIALAVTAFLGILLRPQHRVMQLALNGILIPVEASLMGLLTISLLYAAIRLLRRRANLMSTVFVLTAALIFLGSATLPFGDVSFVGTLLRPWLNQVLALGGMRGILIGVALGTLTAGLRAMFGVDRPYGGK